MTGDMVWRLSAYVNPPGSDTWELKRVTRAAPWDHQWTDAEVVEALEVPDGTLVDDVYAYYDYPVPVFHWPKHAQRALREKP